MPLSSAAVAAFNTGVNADELIADLRRQLAQGVEANASLRRMLEREGFQLDRMQDQLERALGEIAALRKLLNKPPPDEPPPGGRAVAGGDASTAPDPPVTPEHPKAPSKKKSRFGRNAIPAGLERVPKRVPPGVCSAGKGSTWTTLRDEAVEIYDYIPAKIVVTQVTRPVGRCRCCQHIQAVRPGGWRGFTREPGRDARRRGRGSRDLPRSRGRRDPGTGLSVPRPRQDLRVC